MLLTDREWGEFQYKDIFENHHGKRLIKANRISGDTPMLTAGENSNGVTTFTSNKDMVKHKDFISIDMFGNSFYHAYEATGDDNIYFFLNNNISSQSKKFIVTCINNQKSKYSYGKQFRQNNADNSMIILPVTLDGQPDYDFMEAYVKEHESKKKQKYIIYANSVLSKLEYKEVPSLSEKEWSDFKVLDLFDYKRGNQNNMNSLTEGNEMLISAKNINNGLKGFYSSNNDKKSLFEGDCITLNNDGDGGVGLAYYQPYKFLLDTHVYALYSKNRISKYSKLFITFSLSKQRICFSHGRSISKERLEKMIIMLPIMDDGNPDYEYMEQYIKNIEYKKLTQYLTYINISY